jgi:hypothetical protein
MGAIIHDFSSNALVWLRFGWASHFGSSRGKMAATYPR